MDKELIQFYPKVIGDPVKFQRVWKAVHQIPEPWYSRLPDTRSSIDMIEVATTVWQDGAWWCVMVQTGSTIHRSAWGTAQKVTEALADYGTITGINHIDFTHLK